MKFRVKKIQIITAERAEKNRIHIFPDGESIVENMYKRFSRPHKAYKEYVLPLVMEKMKSKFPKEYKLIKNSTWTWNQTAGCSCGCSPAFVGSTKDRLNIYVDIKITNK